MKLNQSRIELKKASNSLEKLNEAKSIEEYESLWRDFLNYLEKSWIKTERECQGVKNKFMPFQGKFKKLRRNDPLLKYLKNARDADVHSIQEILEKRKRQLISHRFAKRQESYHIKKMIIKNGDLEHYEGDEMIFEFMPGYVITKAFTNNGKVYTIPTFHRGKRINNSIDPYEIGKLGLEFYNDFLNQVEDKF